MLDRILDEVDNGVTFEGGEGAEAEVACNGTARLWML